MRMCIFCVVIIDFGVNYWLRYFIEIMCYGLDIMCLNFYCDLYEVFFLLIMLCKDIFFKNFNNLIKIVKIFIFIMLYFLIVKLMCNF